MARFTAFAKALGAIAVLGALLVLVPYLLWSAAGSPLPTTFDPDAIVDTLTAGRISEDLVVKVLAFVGWVAWAQLTASLLVEMSAALRGRAAARIPFAGPMQPFARRLIATIALGLSGIAPIASPLAAVAAPATPAISGPAVGAPIMRSGAALTDAPTMRSAGDMSSAPVMRQVDNVDDTTASAVALDTVAPPTAISASNLMLVVQPRDTLWDISEQYLGDPLRWREIYDMNQGRAFPDGRVFNDPHWIHPAWDLDLPADAVGDRVQFRSPAAVTPAPTAPPATTPLPTTPPSAEIPANEVPAGVADFRSVLNGYQANGGVSPEVQVPLSALPRTTIPAAPIPGLQTQADAGAAGVTSNGAAQDNSTNTQMLVALLGTGLLVGGLVVMIDRKRRKARQRRRVGTWVAEQEPLFMEEAMRARVIESDLDWLDVGLRSLAGALVARPRRTWPLPHAVRYDTNEVEVLLSSGGHFDAPEPWRSAKGGWSWVLDRPEDLTPVLQLAAQAPSAVSSLATLGTSAEGVLLVDIEAFGSVALVGDIGRTHALAAEMATELAYSPLSDEIDVVVVGIDVPAMGTNPRLRQLFSVEALVAEMQQRSAAITAQLAQAQKPNTFAARSHRAGNFAPTVVVIASDVLDRQSAATLTDLADGGGLGVAIIAAGELPEASWRFEVGVDTVSVMSLGISVARQVLPAEVLVAATDVVAEASAQQFISEPIPAAAGEALFGDDVIDLTETRCEVESKVIGEVALIGVHGEIEDPEIIELVAFLAFHRDGVAEERIRTALWTNSAVDDGAVNALASRARVALGNASNGQPFIPETVDGIYRLSNLVATDVELFLSLVDRAKVEAPEQALLTFCEALDQVRGMPFATLRGYGWAHAEGLVARVDALVVDAAHRAAELCLDHGDARGALWAVNQGLVASPVNEMLFCDRMLAYYLVGDRAGIESTMTELERQVAMSTPGDGVSPETRALYRMLLRDDETSGATAAASAAG